MAHIGSKLKLDKLIEGIKGRLIVTDGTTTQALAVGTDGHVLTADSAEATGVKWAAPAAGGGSNLDVLFYMGWNR